MRAFCIGLCAMLVGLGAILSPLGTASAAMLEYAAPCEFGCDEIGLAPGDMVTASFGVPDAALAPFAVIDFFDVTSFSATFGTLTFGFADLVDFGATLDVTATIALDWFVLIAGASGGALIFGVEEDNLFLVQGADTGIAIGGPGSITVSVPEPATLALLALGLAFAGLRRRHPAA